MKKILLLFLLVAYSCDTNPSITIQLIETTTKSGICFAHGIKEISVKKTETSLRDDDFTIGLKLKSEGDYYIAMKRVSCCLEMCSGSQNEVLVINDLYIVDQNKAPKPFASSDDFLDFMSAGNYKMVNEINSITHTDYTFKRIM